jgi:hypothetical protein
MDVYCARCAATRDVDSDSLTQGSCPTCSGQLTTGPVPALSVDGSVAMSFDARSRIGVPFEPRFEQSSLAEGNGVSDSDSPEDDRRPTVEMPTFDTGDMGGERRETTDLPAFSDSAEPPGAPTIPDFPAVPGFPDSSPAAATAPAPPADDGIPAHLKLPTMDFSMPSIPSFGGPGESTPSTAAAAPAPSADSGFPSLDLPSFPKFDMSFDMNAPAAPAAAPAASAAPSGPPAMPAHLMPPAPMAGTSSPPPPPPPRRRATVAQQPAPMFPALPNLGALPDIASAKKEVTLVKSAEAEEIAKQLEKKSMAVPVIIVIVLLLGAGAGVAIWKKDEVLKIVDRGSQQQGQPEDTSKSRAKMLLAEGVQMQAEGTKAQADKKTAKKGKEMLEQAIVKLKSALELDAQLPRAHRELGVIYATMKDEDHAVEHYREYLKLAPDAEDAAKAKKIVEDWEKAQADKKNKKKK